MSKKPAPPTYVDELLSDLETLELGMKDVVNASPVRRRQMSGDGLMVVGHPWEWLDSTPEVEARRMELLQKLRTGAPRFRLLFPHPTPDVQRRLDDGIGLTRVGKSAEQLRQLVALLPADQWQVRLVIDTNALLDDPDVTIYKDAIGPHYMVHLLPVVLRELDETKRAGRH